MKWESQVVKRPNVNAKCICYLSECYCQFQHHITFLTFCEDPEIFQLCLNKVDINYGGI